jgi:hypothetical protein
MTDRPTATLTAREKHIHEDRQADWQRAAQINRQQTDVQEDRMKGWRTDYRVSEQTDTY